MKVTCEVCGRVFRPDKRTKEKYERDNLCGKCRSRVNYLLDIDKYRKTKRCSGCGKLILKTSKFCSSCGQRKEKNHQWKKEKQDLRIYWCAEWKEWRQQVLDRDNYICQLCGDVGNNAHHIYPKRDYPELLYNVDNGVTLCKDCHSIIHFKEEDYIDYFLDVIKD